LLEPTKTGEAFDGIQCSSVRPQTEPDLMAWDAGSRANLKMLHEQGVVAVRYRAEGCNVELEVLDCVGEGKYEFSAYSATESKVAKSAQELFVELPIGAARLAGKLGGGRALRTDYMLSGILRIPVMQAFSPVSLKGTCDRATHVVGKLYVGGFAMATGESEEIAAGVSVFGVGAGADRTRSAERLAEEGNAAACKAAQEQGRLEPLCSVPLRLGLVPIEGRAEGACAPGSSWNGRTCSAGSGDRDTTTVPAAATTAPSSPAPVGEAAVPQAALPFVPAADPASRRYLYFEERGDDSARELALAGSWRRSGPDEWEHRSSTGEIRKWIVLARGRIDCPGGKSPIGESLGSREVIVDDDGRVLRRTETVVLFVPDPPERDILLPAGCGSHGFINRPVLTPGPVRSGTMIKVDGGSVTTGRER
jgi:hypothetical protein